MIATHCNTLQRIKYVQVDVKWMIVGCGEILKDSEECQGTCRSSDASRDSMTARCSGHCGCCTCLHNGATEWAWQDYWVWPSKQNIKGQSPIYIFNMILQQAPVDSPSQYIQSRSLLLSDITTKQKRSFSPWPGSVNRIPRAWWGNMQRISRNDNTGTKLYFG